MKKIILSLCAAVGLLSCDKGGDGLQSPGEAAPLRLRSSIGELVEVSTRESESNDIEKYLLEGTEVTVQIKKATADGEEDYAVDLVYTAGENGVLTTTGETVYYPADGSKLNIYGLCISSEKVDNKYSIVADQSTEENYQTSDFLQSISMGVGYTPTFVPLLFEHLNSKIVLDFNDESFAGYTISDIQISGTKTSATYTNLLVPNVDPTITLGDATGDITPFLVIEYHPITGDETSRTTTYEAIIIPQTIEADAKFISFTITDLKDENIFENLSFELTDEMLFEKNQEYTFKFSLKDKALTATSSVSQWTNGSDIEIEDTIVESKDYTLIYTVDDLKKIEEDLTANYLLMNDLDLQEGKTGDARVNWVPITEFTGHLNGNGFTISGLYANNYTNTNEFGLFAKASFATIENLTIEDPQITANATSATVGAIVGEAENTTIRNCKVLTTDSSSESKIEISNKGSVGAIAGFTSASNIIGCQNSCPVIGSSNNTENDFNIRVGGIVGNSKGSSNIVACSNSGTTTVYIEIAYVGGVVGQNQGSEIIACFSVGNVVDHNDSSTAGAIVGQNEGGNVNHSYYLKDATTNTTLRGVGSNTSGTSGTGTVNTYDVDSYEALNTEGVIGAMNYSVYTYDSHSLFVGGKLDFGFKASDESTNTSAAAQERAPQLVEDLDYNAPKKELQVGYSPIFSVEQLSAMETSKTDVKYQLMTDLDLKGSDTNKWSPIGTWDDTFKGTFDGGGHSISGLYIDNTNETDLYALGLFGRADYATIENLKIINPQIQAGGSGSYYVGAIVGLTNNTTIKNCEVLGDVDATNAYIKLLNKGNVGAIAGSALNSNIIGCHNSCAIRGEGSKNRVGGIVGDSYDFVSIVACSNSGEISISENDSNIGGITGYTSFGYIQGCYSVGALTSPQGSSYAGVIAGNFNGHNIDGCYYLSNEDTNVGMPSVGNNHGYTNSSNSVTSLAALNTTENVKAMNDAVYSFATNANFTDLELYDSTNEQLAFGFLVNGTSGDEAEPLISENVSYPID